MRNTNIESSIIHAVWSSVETINKKALLQLNDNDLIEQIIKQIERNSAFKLHDRQSLMDYISSKVRLIRDIAEF
ncbi:hypothetical protein IQ255_10650 [Pleurocapsales cyanobacterium LEGE 10410]|nr:hypothetical protein [Pleurocapsales cyanobacterium LEGE 10410]